MTESRDSPLLSIEEERDKLLNRLDFWCILPKKTKKEGYVKKSLTQHILKCIIMSKIKYAFGA